MKVIHKYPISFHGDVTVQMPKEAGVVAVGLDGGGQPCVWALTNLDAPLAERRFGIYGTGGQVPDTWQYRGTFFDQPYGWHVFEETSS